MPPTISATATTSAWPSSASICLWSAKPIAAGRQEGEQDVADEAPRQAVAPRHAGDDGRERPPVEHDDREDRAELDDDVEQLPAVGVEAEQAAGEDQVPGRRHGQELGHALDDAEDDDVEQAVAGAGGGKHVVTPEYPNHYFIPGTTSRWKRPDVR